MLNYLFQIKNLIVVFPKFPQFAKLISLVFRV